VVEVTKGVAELKPRVLAAGDVLRPARIPDAPQIQRLVNQYASQGLMLPKSLNQVLQNIRDFVVVEREGEVQACGALHLLWNDLAEVRSLAVRDERRGNGLGRVVVEALLEQARGLSIPRVFALTYQRSFFERVGFSHIERTALPRKIWVDCIDCLKFPDCDEEGVIIDLPTEGPDPGTDGLRKALVTDVDEIVTLINGYAAQGRMLARSRSHVYQNLRDFTVFAEDGHVIACGALHVLWDDLAEVRAVAVKPDRVGQGLGSDIVRGLIEDARALGLPGIFAFTYERPFFERLGFEVVDKEFLPRKVWGECLDCPKFPDCDEFAMTLKL
jgi:amino-acid N-acetyltransferase